MLRKYQLAVALLSGLASLSTLPVIGTGAVAFAAEQSGDLQAQGLAALKAYWTAIVAGTTQALDPLLAPEYQIERADGSGSDKATYLKGELTKVAAVPEFTGVSVTGTADLLVVRYEVTIDSTRKGKTVQRHAPRLTVFRKQGDAWLVVAHANFATLAK
jgi:hypothetical protein